VPQDPESFTVRDVDQVLSIVQQNAADCVECLKRPRIRRVIQVQQSYELGRATNVPTKRPLSFRGRKPDALFGNFTRLTTFGRYGLVTSTIVKPSTEACWMYRYCLLPCPCRKIWLTEALASGKWATTVTESASVSGLCFAIALGAIATKSKRSAPYIPQTCGL
jgi:hypothetical protein